MWRTTGQLPGGVHDLSPEEVEQHQRHRIRHGFAHVVSVAGYDATSISAIVEVAQLSKRTFYDCYVSKESAYLDMYRWLTGGLLTALRRSRENEQDPRARLDATLRTAIALAAQDPVLAETWLLGVYPVSEAVVNVRQAAMDELTLLLVRDLKEAGVSGRTRVACEMSVGGVCAVVRSELAQAEPPDLARLVSDLKASLVVSKARRRRASASA